MQEIRKLRPDIIGFSCYIWNVGKIVSLSKKIRKVARNTMIVLGGPHLSPIAEHILRNNRHINIIVRGEGEATFLELVKALSGPDGDIQRIEGITYRYKSRIVRNPDREMIQELDSIPSFYRFDSKELEGKYVCLETQRGCEYRCHYCYYHKNFNKVRVFSIDRVKKDLAFLLKKKLRAIYLMDPVFNLDPERAKEICRFIVKHNRNNIPFHAEIRAELVDEELADLLHRANFKYLEIGLQSATSRVLQLVGRKSDIVKFVRGVHLCTERKLGAQVQLILGLPGETVCSFMESLEFVMGLEPEMISVFVLQVLPGTKLWEDAARLGIVHEKDPPYRFLRSEGISALELKRLQKIVVSLEIFWKMEAFRFLCREKGIKLLDLIRVWVDRQREDGFLLEHPGAEEYQNRLRQFMRSFCLEHGIEPHFYEVLLSRGINRRWGRRKHPGQFML